MAGKALGGMLVLLSLAAPASTASGQTRAEAACVLRQGHADDAVALTRCLRFSQPRRMRGIWIIGFELEDFLAGATAIPREWDPRSAETNLVFPNRAGEAYFDSVHGRTRAYFVDFIGRVSAGPALMAQRVIVVERLLSIRRLAWPARARRIPPVRLRP